MSSLLTFQTKAGGQLFEDFKDSDPYFVADIVAAILAIENEAAAAAPLDKDTLRAETVAATLDACREHMSCACSGIEGHLAERGLLFEPMPTPRVVPTSVGDTDAR